MLSSACLSQPARLRGLRSKAATGLFSFRHSRQYPFIAGSNRILPSNNPSTNSTRITATTATKTVAFSHGDCPPIYRPLNRNSREIRLLRLLAGSACSDIHCVLEHSSCPEATKYDAISYYWGDECGQKRIFLNGQPHPITRNAEAALRSLRHEAIEKIIWIDTLCINQSDVAERNHQVGIMKQIYQNANRTWVWLGHDNNFAAEAVEMISHLADQMSNRINLCNDPMEILTDYESGLFTPLAPELPPFSSSKWDSIARYFSLPWFTRIWIIQEVAFSQDAILKCGDEMISWDLVQLAAHEIDYQSLDGRSNRRGLDKVQNVMSIEMLGSNDSGLSSILCATRDFQATDPRDKVFAVLGLTHQASSNLVPDYNLSISEAYRQVVRFLVQSMQDLTVLGDIDHSATEQSSVESTDFSSWIPRFNEPRTCSILVRAYPPFQAAGQRIDMETIPSDSHVLALGGLRIDTLAVLGPVMTSDMMASGSGLCQIWNQCLNFVPSYPTGEHVLRAFSLTMAADKTLKGESAAVDPNHDEDFAAYITGNWT